MGMKCPKCQWNIKWREEEGKPEKCPKCGARLSKAHRHSYRKDGICACGKIRKIKAE